jgi:rhamnosyltransferase
VTALSAAGSMGNGHTALIKPVIVVITAYKPGPGLLDRYACLLKHSQSIVVSDNTPGGSPDLMDRPGIKILKHGRNLGLGAALNAGIQWAQSQGAARVLLLDQDSGAGSDLLASLLHEHDSLSIIHGPRICVGPAHVEPATAVGGSHAPPLRIRRAPKSFIRERTCLPTSGMLISLGKASVFEGFSTDFFLDLVDYEWCWRLRRYGWKFFRLEQLHMPHRRGLRTRRVLGLSYFEQEPYRHYFQVRDTLRLLGIPYVPVYSLIRLLAFMVVKSLTQPLLLDRGLERVKWSVLGIRDAITGKVGVGAAATQLE